MRFRVWVTLNEAPAGHAEQVVSIDARQLRIAVNRGLRQILSDPHLKRRRIRSGKITFVRLDTNDSAGSNTNGNGNGGSE